jgi:tetratricopeptide (TPR) repeat protein
VHHEPPVQAVDRSNLATTGKVFSPADIRIEAAERAIEQHPHRPQSYDLLASAYMQKARETNDFGFNSRAEAALARALAVAPDDYDARKQRAKLLLTYHRFSEALELARSIQKIRPDDHDVYGAITDAEVELGDYAGAIEAAQKMVDLRPDSAAYARVSYLRSLHGDTEGAIQAMTVAVKAADPNDSEGLAWCRVHLGDELMNAGRSADAEREYDKALLTFSDYPLALAAKARARIRAGDQTGAVELYEQSQKRAPMPDTAIALGDLYAKLGRPDQARRQYELVEFIEQNSSAGGTYSRQLAILWADHDVKLDQALTIVQRERSARQDVFTCDALAWVLLKNNRLEEAKKAIAEALRLGTRDARIFYHAGMIYDAIGDKGRASKYLRLAIATNPTFDLLQADQARQTFAAINNPRPANIRLEGKRPACPQPKREPTAATGTVALQSVTASATNV